MSDPWALMDLPHGASVRDVKRRYAQLVKHNRPEDNPGGFQMLRRAYEICLAHAGPAQEAEAPATATTDLAPNAVDTATPAVAVRDASPSEPVPMPPVIAATVAIEPEPPAPAPSRHAARREPPVVAHERLALERLATLRSPAAVVDALLVAADPARAATTTFDAWFADCAELANFAAREAIERELLERLASDETPLDADAFFTLEQSFGWSQVGFARRLAAGGLPPARVERVAAAIERRLVDAQFARHLAGREALYARTPEQSHAVLGNAAAEHAELRRLHGERERPQRRWRRALKPSRVNTVNRLFHGYAERYGTAAVDRLFGADAVTFWNLAHPGNPPNRVQIALSTLRWLLGFAAFGVAVTALLVATDEPDLGPAMRVLWLTIATSTVVVVAATAARRRIRMVTVPRLAGRYASWRLGVDRYLRPAVAVPALAAFALLGSVAGAWLGAGWIALAALAAIGFVLGRSAFIGALLLTWLGGGAIDHAFGAGTPFMAIGAALLPFAAWLGDRVALRTTGPDAMPGAREGRTYWLLLGAALALLVASVAWSARG